MKTNGFLRLVVAGITPASAALFAGICFGQSAAPRAVMDQYCVRCHSNRVKTGGLSLEKVDVTHPDQNAELFEKIIRKVRAGLMPPAGMPRPDAVTLSGLAAALESGIDQVAVTHPNAGRPALHRLNRAEYANSIRDLLGLKIDPASLLPPDDSSHGFDNMAEVLNVSPTLMEAYVSAAGKIARTAMGDPGMAPIVETYHLPQSFSQLQHVEGAPFGTRGGIVVHHNFPADGEYVFKMTFYYSSIGPMFGATQKDQQIEVAVNGQRVALLNINPKMKVDEDVRTPPIKVKAGPQTISAAFIEKAGGLVEDALMPFQGALDDLSTGYVPGLTGLPHLRDLGISGPFNATGVGDTPSRQKILICRPTLPSDEPPCAKKIIAQLMRQAYRRPADESDLQELLAVYKAARSRGDFDSGIRIVVQALVANSQFVFRIETPPERIAPGTNYRISDLELASRLSYFLWSSAPDEQLSALAAEGKLKDPKILEQQVQRMVANSKSEALATNFAEQWLGLRNLNDVQPDDNLFPDFNNNLMRSMRRETQLLFESIMHENRNIVDLLTANYTFVDGRLALHYGIPNIVGTRFRRVTLTDENRFGLLGQASILTATSLANRTSPVNRGKWILEQLLGVSAPTPPRNVPPLRENGESAGLQSVREKMQQHRRNEPCASCHKIMDPLGFALENFDAIGAWRIRDSGFDIDPSGQLYDGTKVNGPVSLRQALVSKSDVFTRNFTAKLLTYALGRGLEYYDMPVVRSIDNEAAKNDHHFMSIVMGIVKSTPFQMRRSEEPVKSEAAGRP
jgi:cytochrome c551/c552